MLYTIGVHFKKIKFYPFTIFDTSVLLTETELIVVSIVFGVQCWNCCVKKKILQIMQRIAKRKRELFIYTNEWEKAFQSEKNILFKFYDRKCVCCVSAKFNVSVKRKHNMKNLLAASSPHCIPLTPDKTWRKIGATTRYTYAYHAMLCIPSVLCCIYNTNRDKAMRVEHFCER